MSNKDDDVVELLSSDEEEEENKKPPARNLASETAKNQKTTVKRKKKANILTFVPVRSASLQSGIVLEEDVEALVQHAGGTGQFSSYIEEQEKSQRDENSVELYHDEDFSQIPASIQGAKAKTAEKIKCRCGLPVGLFFSDRENSKGRPFYRCPKEAASSRCQYFKWAFQADLMQWYRFGNHTGHVFVRDTGFSADDLLQGRVGDCWFLSALAVVCLRPDLVERLVGKLDTIHQNNNDVGIVKVNLFIDGFWTPVVMDNFLPCLIDDKAENEIQKAINASLGLPTTTSSTVAFQGPGYSLSGSASVSTTTNENKDSSKYDPSVMSDVNIKTLTEAKTFLKEQQKAPINPYAKKPPSGDAWRNFTSSGASKAIVVPEKLQRAVKTEDLAYSKTKHNQLWVSFLEKAYAKTHGSYQAISGGHIAEAFLDLTGAPTKVHRLLNDRNFDPKDFWYQLLTYRRQQLPMGCGTDSSAVGIIGMHAYSILDVVEVKNVGVEFFADKLKDRTLGNVSGFTTFDGTVRLLQIRNPHGKGEWKGEFSDGSAVWEKLLQHMQRGGSGETPLHRSHKNDGVFWIDYDSFLQGFANVDVVLAFMGNHAKSFKSNFPEKKSNARCTRAFEVCLLDPQPGVPSRDTVELYVMGIQQSRRGATLGRDGRKVSYKYSDMGLLVGKEGSNQHACRGRHDSDDEDEDDSGENLEFSGEMFGFNRNGHHRLILDRKGASRWIVMPVSFGHPAATDKERSFAVRFVADAPLMIRELPDVPRIDRALHKFCFPRRQLNFSVGQRKRKVLWESPDAKVHGEPLYRVFQIDCLANRGGVVFVYVGVNQPLLKRKGLKADGLSLKIEATCRGMMCRTETGFVTHETLAKGKKFEAAWRLFRCDFACETKTRLLMVLVQSGQSTEMGAVTCECNLLGEKERSILSTTNREKTQTVMTASGELLSTSDAVSYEKLGIFNDDCCPESSALHNTMFGSMDVAASSVDVVGQSMFDMELERALALSRGDPDLQTALELSKRDTRHNGGSFNPSATGGGAMTEEQAMQLALERSKVETAGASTFSSSKPGADLDFEEAIKRSLQATNVLPRKKDDIEVVDVDSEESASNHRRAQQQQSKRQKIGNGEGSVIQIDDDNDDGEEDKKKKSIEPPNESKRQKMDEDAVIEIDDDDGESGEGSSESEPSTENSAELLANRRKLAAEAAEKRFQGIK